jgi:hypothetical protein
MNASFDYLTVLLSIVIGLAITNVLTRLALLIQARERVKFYWPPVAWALWIFFIAVQHWWAQWSARHSENRTLFAFWLQLLVPVLLFLLTALALPDREENGKIDLEDWYFRNRQWFFGLLFFVPLISILEEVVRTGRMDSLPNFWFLVAFDAMAIVAYFVKSRRAGEWIAALAIALTAAYVALLYSTLPG